MLGNHLRALGTVAGAALVLAACASVEHAMDSVSGAIGPADGPQQTAAPHEANGVSDLPRMAPVYRALGVASWYGRPFHGRRTASGQVYDMHALTAAHRTLPFGTRVRVTNLENTHSVVLTVNDRGPFVRGRIIDVSRRAAEMLKFLNDGLTRVRIQVIDVAPG